MDCPYIPIDEFLPRGQLLIWDQRWLVIYNLHLVWIIKCQQCFLYWIVTIGVNLELLQGRCPEYYPERIRYICLSYNFFAEKMLL